jgi:DNA-binding NarL/FixJ family response regulator
MPSPSSTTVLIVDDHPLYRAGLRQVVESDPRFTLLAEADNGEAALSLIAQRRPDVVVLDINLPGMSGLDIAGALQAKSPAPRVVMLTMFKDEQVFNQAMNLGVLGFVLKENAATEILRCIASVAAGEPYVSPVLTGFLMRRHQRASSLAARQPNLDDLTTAERRILRAVAQKKSSKEIAAEFGVSPRTVESHRANICTKLNLQGSNVLLQYALEHRDELSQLT